MIPWSLSRIAEVVGGRLNLAEGSLLVDKVAIDSRADVTGALFVAIRGDNVDGHVFAQQVLDDGAVAVLAERELGVPAIIVDDTVAALGHLAAAYRRSLPDLTILALTGSSGKTTAKDLLASVLESVAPTVAPRGSFNSEVGLPLTVLDCTQDTRFLVLEMGMRGPGHIAYLCEIGAPTIGAVINVGSAHLGMLGSREAIALAKGEILDGLPSAADGGVAVLHGDNPVVAELAGRTRARVVMFGESATADVRAESVRLNERAEPEFTLVSDGQSGQINLQLTGEHQVANACAAAAMALAAGIDFDQVVTALNTAQSRSHWRMEVTTRPDGVTIINDAYNANPESMRAALKALVAVGAGRRTWAVLGPMGELGDDSSLEHDDLGRMIVRLDINKLISVGELTRPLHLGACLEGSWGDEAAWVPDVDAAIAILADQLRPGDVVLVKASRSFGFEKIAAALSEVSTS